MTTITVTSLNDSGTGSLRDALSLANDGDTITFDPSLAGGTLVLTSGELDTNKNITIEGVTNADGTPAITISGNNASRVFNFGSATSDTLDALVIMNGNVGGAGGALLGQSLTVINSRLDDNSASGGIGGAIFASASLTLINSAIDHNSALIGGGINVLGFANIVNSTLSGNSAQTGGGAYVTFGNLTVVNGTLSGNSASGDGGGIYARSGTTRILDSTLTGNYSHKTGGIAESSGFLTLSNSIVAGNYGQEEDDVAGPFSTIYFKGNNILGSSPTASGGSIDTSNGNFTQIDGTSYAGLGTVFARVGHNPDTGVLSGVLADNGGPVRTVAINHYAGAAYNTGSNAALPPNTFNLDSSGNTTEPLPVDARGQPRVAGGTVDIGAFEQQQGTNFVVTTLADNPYDGKTLAGELAEGNGLSLRQAIGLANQDRTSQDVITFAPDLIGGSTPGVNNGVLLLTNGELTIDSNVTINGDINGDGTPDITIDGQGASRDFNIVGGSAQFNPVTLNGLTITGGNAYVDGGGVSLKQGNYGPLDVTISNSIISNNQAAYGGGISVEFNDILDLNNSVVSGNSAAYVGGGIAGKRGSLYLRNTTVSGNSSGYIGGGIANGEGGLTTINSTISNNRITSLGGPLYDSAGAGLYNSGETNLVNTTVSANTGAYAGGGIYNSLGLFLVNATIANNSATNGGGLYNARCGCGYAKLYDSTFTGNNAQQLGGGIYNTNGTVILTNNLVAGNRAGYQGSDLANGSSATTTYTGVNLFSQAGVGRLGIDITQSDLTKIFASLTTIDPDGIPNSGDEFQAGTLVNNGGPVETVAIKLGGSAQDTGSTAALPRDLFDLNNNGNTTEPLPVDARGEPRVFGPAVDIGAFEAQRVPEAVPFDLNGDGNSDLVFQSNGQPGIWLMNGATPIAEAALANPGASWHIITSRDLNGDGNADLIWQNSDGTPGVWLMNGTTPIAEAGFANPGASWHIVASGDVNGDGKADLIWQNSDGTLGVWLMNGTTPIAQAGIGNPGANWKVVGSADFNGDGKDDILLQDTNTGNLQIDVMNGASIASTASITLGDPSWHAVSTGEFNGQAEIAWQNNNGTVGVWLMNGASPVAQAGLGNPGAGWQLVSVDHFTPNGQADLLFQNTNGAMMLWEMNGASLAAQVNLPNPTAAWQSVNGHPFAA
ncbi:MAG: VCBS repeat-containing protein [Hyphomicrobiales bacterium]|nr:VCBS repeat-containing protein [Hyphomicrobiales bacterium]MBV8825598.1 VCBS repeat-containing protein [Hyphomicrobiales bacterium]MBV9427596.1 VCBS repeat-containing protein [Bradyrhizobiaceae bacterium]